MKQKNIIFLLFIVLQINTFAQSHFQDVAKKNKALPGQTAPYDMIFVEGTRDMPSFYIGIQEEPNINYMIYLKWLIRVFGHEPILVLNALPFSSNDPNKHIMDTLFRKDEYFGNFTPEKEMERLFNPKYAYEPVTNLSWKQIQNYMAWKTDRLNEMILIKNDVLKFDLSPSNANNFNSESCVFGQYEGLRGKSPSTDLSDATMFFGFRLPTEGEWEYANKKLGVKQSANQPQPFKRPQYPFGKEYFLLQWGRALEIDEVEINYKKDKFIQKLYYNIDTCLPKEAWQDGVNDLYRIISEYPTDTYGIINMDGGVKEWLLDEYSVKIDTVSNWLQVMKHGGFETQNNIKHHPDHFFIQKDSMGRMQSFRMMGMDQNGVPRLVSHQPYGNKRLRVVKGGDENNPSMQRMALDENKFGSNIGFRCVLPYTGAPVHKGYKVNWDESLPKSAYFKPDLWKKINMKR